MKKLLVCIAALSLVACSQDPLLTPVPDTEDMAAVGEIARELPEEGGEDSDKRVFVQWAMRESLIDNGIMSRDEGEQKATTVGEAIELHRAFLERKREKRLNQEIEQAQSNCESTKPRGEFELRMTWDEYTFQEKKYEGPCEALRANNLSES